MKLCKQGGPNWLPVVRLMEIWSLQTSSVRPAGLVRGGPCMPLMRCRSTSWRLSMRSTYDTHSAMTALWWHRVHHPNMTFSLLAVFRGSPSGYQWSWLQRYQHAVHMVLLQRSSSTIAEGSAARPEGRQYMYLQAWWKQRRVPP